MRDISSQALKFTNGKLKLLDQQLLPHKEEWITCEDIDDLVAAIKALKVRGAPLIGVSAVFGLAQLAANQPSLEEFKRQAVRLREARPTAVNLMICIDRILRRVEESKSLEPVIELAYEIFDEDRRLCDQIASFGAELIPDGAQLLTHCNTGGLATAGYGTAFAVIKKAHDQGKKIHVYVDETRPLLQGARLTAWELKKAGVPHTLNCDNMAAHLMKEGRVDQVWVGADRIAQNGDFANKIGTYSLAVLARYHKLDMYVAAPWTTFDSECLTGRDIPIEERNPKEVLGFFGATGECLWASEETAVTNPAFDVTPVELVRAVVTDFGVFSSEDARSKKLFNEMLRRRC